MLTLENRMRRLKATLVSMLLVASGMAYCFRIEPAAEAPAKPAAAVAQAAPSIDESFAPARWRDGWRTFAAPLALPSGETLLFQRDGTRPVAWRLDWKSGKATRTALEHPRLIESKGRWQRFTAVSTRDGLWLIGSSVALMRPGDLRIYPEFGADEPVAVGLADGSVLVIGGGSGNPAKDVRRLSFKDAGGIQREWLPDLPQPRYGIGAAALADGRVMIAGGDRADTRVQLFDPASRQWSEAAPMTTGRVFMALVALPDGRVVAAGGGWQSNAAAHSAEIWEPATNTWSPLPPLPLSLHISAYGANAPSGAVLPDGSLVLGGGLDNGVLLLRARGTGWAPSWTVVGMSDVQRAGGVVQALGNQDVVVAGGVFAPDHGSCCSGRPGASRVAWRADGAEQAQSFGLARAEPVGAQSGSDLFVIGGWRHFSMSFGAIQYSGMAELVDLKSGRARQLASPPGPIGAGRAAWIDADRIAVKAVQQPATDNRFRGMDVREIEVGDGTGFFAVYSRAADAWRALNDARLAGAELAGVRGKEAVLVGGDARAWAVDVDTFAVRDLPRRARQRSGGTARVLADGRVVVAGGQAQESLVALADPACDTAQCPDRYVGFGAMSPAGRHEIFAAGQWRLSAPAAGVGGSAVVLADGSVVKSGLARDPARPAAAEPAAGRFVVERSTPDGSAWRALPLPPGLADVGRQEAEALCPEEGYPSRCELRLAADPLRAGAELLFFVQEIVPRSVDQIARWRVWLFDEAGTGWRAVGDWTDRNAFRQAVDLPGRAQGQGGRRVRGQGFDRPQVSVWAE